MIRKRVTKKFLIFRRKGGSSLQLVTSSGRELRSGKLVTEGALSPLICSGCEAVMSKGVHGTVRLYEMRRRISVRTQCVNLTSQITVANFRSFGDHTVLSAEKQTEHVWNHSERINARSTSSDLSRTDCETNAPRICSIELVRHIAHCYVSTRNLNI